MARIRRVRTALICTLILLLAGLHVIPTEGQSPGDDPARWRSFALAAAAREAIARSDGPLAVTLALLAVGGSNPPIEAQAALARAAYSPGVRAYVPASHDPVVAFAINPSVDTLLTISASYTLTLLDLPTGMPKHSVKTRADNAAFSPDGAQIATVNCEGSVIVWEATLNTPQHGFAFGAEQCGIPEVVFSPDGKLLAVGAASGEITLWRTSAESRLWSLDVGKQLFDLTFSPDGMLLATAVDQSVVLWNTVTGERTAVFENESGSVTAVAFGPQGNQIAIGTRDGQVRVADYADHAFTALGDALYTPGLQVEAVAFSQDTRSVIAVTYDGIEKWPYQDPESRRTTRILASIARAEFGPDERYLAALTEDRSILVFDIQPGDYLGTLRTGIEGYGGVISAVAFSPDGRMLLGSSTNPGGSGYGVLYLWDTATGSLIREFAGDYEGAFVTFPDIYSVAFSPDGRWLAGSGEAGRAFIWNVATRAVVQKVTADRQPVAFTPDGKYWLVANNSTLRLYDPVNDVLVGELRAHTAPVVGAQFSSNGQKLLTASSDGTAILWDVGTRTKRRTLQVAYEIASLALSPDAKYVFLGGNRGKVHLGQLSGVITVWDLTTGTHIRTLFGDQDTLWAVIYVASIGEQGAAAATSYSGTLLWDIATGDVLREIGAGDSAGESLAIHPDLRSLAVGTDYGTVDLWRIDTLPDLIRWTRANRYARPLTCAERERYNVEPLCGIDGIPTP